MTPSRILEGVIDCGGVDIGDAGRTDSSGEPGLGMTCAGLAATGARRKLPDGRRSFPGDGAGAYERLGDATDTGEMCVCTMAPTPMSIMLRRHRESVKDQWQPSSSVRFVRLVVCF